MREFQDGTDVFAKPRERDCEFGVLSTDLRRLHFLLCGCEFEPPGVRPMNADFLTSTVAVGARCVMRYDASGSF